MIQKPSSKFLIRTTWIFSGNRMSEEDSLATEPYSEIKREFLAGAVYAMSGADEPHNFISTNLIGLLFNLLRGERCAAFGSDMQARITTADQTTLPFRCCPDAMIACDPAEKGKKWREKPSALFEITSRNTRRMAAFQACVRIEHDRPTVTLHLRTPEGWRSEQVSSLDGMVRLPSLEIELPLAGLYERVEFPPAK